MQRRIEADRMHFAVQFCAKGLESVAHRVGMHSYRRRRGGLQNPWPRMCRELLQPYRSAFEVFNCPSKSRPQLLNSVATSRKLWLFVPLPPKCLPCMCDRTFLAVVAVVRRLGLCGLCEICIPELSRAIAPPHATRAKREFKGPSRIGTLKGAVLTGGPKT